EHLEGLTPEAEVARERLFTRMGRVARAGRRFDTRRAEAAELVGSSA
ncbi:MAG: hypothetical protein JWM89_249, partial [Acidimicrobiales bacterium]|nr:hypothetical protein [Acidimicrobiales bacterium]